MASLMAAATTPRPVVLQLPSAAASASQAPYLITIPSTCRRPSSIAAAPAAAADLPNQKHSQQLYTASPSSLITTFTPHPLRRGGGGGGRPFAKSTATTATDIDEGATENRHFGQDYLVKKVSAKEVYGLVTGRRVPLLVDFYATWCGPCALMAQDLEMLAVEYGDNLIIVKVDTDDECEFAQDMQVRGLPTLYFFSPEPSKNAIRTEGLIPIQMMRQIIEDEL